MRITAAAISRTRRSSTTRTVGAWLLRGPPCWQNSPLYPSVHTQPTLVPSVTQVPWPWQLWAAQDSGSGRSESFWPLAGGEDESSGVDFPRNLHSEEFVFGPEGSVLGGMLILHFTHILVHTHTHTLHTD